MYNKILAPLDGSKLSECSLAHVKEIAAGCQVRDVILLTVIERPPAVIVEYGSQTQIEEAFKQQENQQKQAKDSAEKYLTGARATLIKQGIPVQNVIIEAEENQSVAEVVLNYAEKNKIDLIVMSSHGRSGVTRWAFGSVADRIVRHSKTPVLTIAPAGCRVQTT